MDKRTLHIQHMVCPRCIRVVREDLEKLGVEVGEVELGKAKVSFDETKISLHQIEEVLRQSGFELLQDREQQLIEAIKVSLIELLDNPALLENHTTSDFLAKKLGVNYSHLSKLFSKQAGITIEKQLIQLKIQKVKELLKYDHLSLEEIAVKLGYSSAAHLSRQFKSYTGMTISEYRKQ